MITIPPVNCLFYIHWLLLLKERYNQDQKNICSSLSSSKRLLEGNTVDLDDILTKVTPKNETIQNLPPLLDTDQLRSATTSDGLYSLSINFVLCCPLKKKQLLLQLVEY